MAYFIGNLFLFDNLLSLMGFMAAIGFVENVSALLYVSPQLPSNQNQNVQICLDKALPCLNDVQLSDEKKIKVEKRAKIEKRTEVRQGSALSLRFRTFRTPWLENPWTHSSIIIILSIFIVIATFFTLKITCQQAYQTNKEIVKAYSAGSLEEVIETYAQAYPKAVIGKQEIAEQLANLASDVANNPVPESTKNRYFEVTRDVMNTELSRQPDYVRLQIVYGNVLEAQKENLEAIKIYENVQKLAPKRQSNLILLAMLYAKNKEFGKAQKLLKQTYLLEPSDEEPLVYQAVIYSLNNQKAQRSAIISRLSIDALGRYYNLIKYSFTITNDLKKYLETFRRRSNSDYEGYYKEWANIAYILKDFSEVETAIITYRLKFSGFSFTIPNDYDLLRKRIQEGENPAFVFEKAE